MGLLRVLLAMMVVFDHLHVNVLGLVNSRFAVQMFFLISGFYIAMVWQEKYSLLDRPLSSFYLSRFFRIYPLYFLVLVLSVLCAWYGLASGHISALLALLAYPLTGFGSLIVLLPQLSLIGMDISWFFMRLQDGAVVFSPVLSLGSRPAVFEFLFIPQAWSLSLELMFYAIAPFVLGRRNWLVGLLLLSVGLRVVMW